MPDDVNILAEDGEVARRLPGYEVRPQQLAMAEAVAEALSSEEHLLVEAGTGVGKSFAYLVPAIQHVIRHGGRVVISTHTIALQEQLIEKDIPFLQSVFPQKFTAVLVKGRGNYLGLRRLTRASGRQQLLFDTKSDLSELHRIEDWAYKTSDGSLSDLPHQPKHAVWDRVRSESDDCMGRRCPHYQKCFYQRARRRAEKAQILVVNHALLFSDVALRREGASILPDYEYLVLDEAHTVEDVAGDHLGLSVVSTQVRFLLSMLHNQRTGKGVLHGRGAERVIPYVAATGKVADGYFDTIASWSAQQGTGNGRLREPPDVRQPLSDALVDLHGRLRDFRADLDDDEERSEIAASMERCMSLATAVDSWHQQRMEDWVYWIEVGDQRRRRTSLTARPVDVAPILRDTLLSEIKCAVFTSATLSTGAEDPFSYMRGRLGLDDEVKSLALGSPFDYRKQVTVHVEADMPDPASGEKFVEAAIVAIRKYLLMSDGRAFVLFTGYDMLRRCAEVLTPFLAEHEMLLLEQGSGLPRTKMLGKFREVERSVLFGTATFWAGVDVPGEALSNVIIVKLPFAVPNQPVVEARIERIRRDGGNPFMQYQVPEALLKFRQGAGRLIRSRQDRGIIAILDPRVVSKPYGRRFLKALPDCEVVVHTR